jgi:RNA polymerase sigma factor (sigma-70 family)
VTEEELAEQFEGNRSHLRSVAYRMLGSHTEADDAVPEAFLRLSRAGTNGIDNFAGWATTIVARVCLDMLRTRKSRREVAGDADIVALRAIDNPEREQVIADSVGAAMLIVLETLTPAERVAFVLHDVFNISFDEIATIVGRSPAATRQLASRARRRVQGNPAEPARDRARHREVVSAFLTASQSGDFSALLAILDPEVILRADPAAVEASARVRVPGIESEVRGRDPVANIFGGRAKAAQLALVDGAAGLVFLFGSQPRMLIEFVIETNRIVEISLVADPEHVALRELEV